MPSCRPGSLMSVIFMMSSRSIGLSLASLSRYTVKRIIGSIWLKARLACRCVARVRSTPFTCRQKRLMKTGWYMQIRRDPRQDGFRLLRLSQAMNFFRLCEWFGLWIKKSYPVGTEKRHDWHADWGNIGATPQLIKYADTQCCFCLLSVLATECQNMHTAYISRGSPTELVGAVSKRNKKNLLWSDSKRLSYQAACVPNQLSNPHLPLISYHRL